MVKKIKVYVVEKIVKHRILKRLAGTCTYDHIEVQVKWEGYSQADNTWEPLTSIYKDIASHCRKYFKERGLLLTCKSIGAFFI